MTLRGRFSGGKFRGKARSSTSSTSSVQASLDFLDPQAASIVQAKDHPRCLSEHLWRTPVSPGSGDGITTTAPAPVMTISARWAVGSGSEATEQPPKPSIRFTGIPMRPVHFRPGKSFLKMIFRRPITLGNTYTAYVKWDGVKFTLRFENDEVQYVPTTSIRPPFSPWKAIGSGVWENEAGLEASIEAFYDDVMVGGAHATVNPSSVEFNDVRVGDQADRDIVIGNTGEMALELSNPVVAPNPPFAGGSMGRVQTFPSAWTPAQPARWWPVSTPTAGGGASGSAVIATNDPVQPVLTIPLHGTGGVPDIKVNPKNLPFGKVTKGNNAHQSIHVRNDGLAPLTLTGIGPSGSPAAPFSITGGTCSTQTPVAPAAECTIDVAFAPTAQGTAQGNFSITSNDPDEGTIAVQLTGEGAAILVTPDEGTLGTEVTITGGGFGSSKGKVTIGGVAPKVTLWDRQRNQGNPEQGPGCRRTQRRRRRHQGEAALRPSRSRMPSRRWGPVISSVAPASGASGSTSAITIQGNYFTTKKGKVTLERGGVVKSCKVVTWGMTTITFQVPKKMMAATDYVLRVSNSVDDATTTFGVTVP